MSDLSVVCIDNISLKYDAALAESISHQRSGPLAVDFNIFQQKVVQQVSCAE